MPPRALSRSKDGEFPTSLSPMRVPRTIQAVNSGASLCSAITLDDSLDTMRPIRRKDTRSLSPILSPPREFQSKAYRRRSVDGSSPFKRDRRRRKGKSRDRDGLSQSEHCHSTKPFRRMDLDISGHRDLPPNPKILLRRSTEPLPSAAREACLQALGYLEDEDSDGEETMLVDRFSPSQQYEDDFFPPSLCKLDRDVSGDSGASMPLRMPTRKASMEGIPVKEATYQSLQLDLVS